MFCKFCGNSVDDQAVFCSKCGKSLVNMEPASMQSAAVYSTGSMTGAALAEERAGMNIYLSDICALEFMINKLKTKQNKLKSDISYYHNYNYCKDYDLHHTFKYRGNSLEEFNKFLFGYDGTNYYFGLNHYGAWVPEQEKNLGLFHPKRRKSYYSVLDDERIASLSAPVEYMRVHFLEERANKNSYWYTNGYHYEDKNGLNPLREAFVKTWKDFKEIAPTNYQKRQEACRECESQLCQVENEILKASELLEKEYALNIIPSKLRNLAAIYYIYEYFNTSAETLSSIFFHLDLDEIKSKLDTIIANQQEMIINQAIQISQNDTIIAQNEMTLKKLSSLEKTAAHTSQLVAQNIQWTQIAANNAEACAWIAAAQFIR